MTGAGRPSLSDFLRQLARTSRGTAVEDAQLLEQFAHGRDEAAFRALLDRHGPLVWGLCRKWLPKLEDAEDQLGWTEGMVKGRLERARARLRARLAPAILLVLGPLAEPAPASLMRSTARLANLVPAGGTLAGVLTTSVAALVEGTLRSM